jgi:hypothetical protein
MAADPTVQTMRTPVPLPRGSQFAPFELGTAVENLVPMCIPKSAG